MKRLPIAFAILTLAATGAAGSCGAGPVRPNAQLDQISNATEFGG